MRKTPTYLRALCASLFALCASASAESVSLTRQQASELYVALAKLEPGLAAANAITAADNLNELRPIVEALEKGKVAAQRQIRATPGITQIQREGLVGYSFAAPEAEAAYLKINDAFEAKSLEPVKLDLARLDLTPDEITAAKIPPGQLAVIRQHLKPKAK